MKRYSKLQKTLPFLLAMLLAGVTFWHYSVYVHWNMSAFILTSVISPLVFLALAFSSVWPGKARPGVKVLYILGWLAAFVAAEQGLSYWINNVIYGARTPGASIAMRAVLPSLALLAALLLVKPFLSLSRRERRVFAISAAALLCTGGAAWGAVALAGRYAARSAAMTITDIVYGENEIAFTLQGEKQPPLKLRLTLAGENMWRLQSAVNGEFTDIGAAQTLARDLGEPYDSVRLPFEASRVGINLSPFSLTIGNARIDSVYTRDGNLAVHGVLSKDEGLFGCGQQFNAANQRGKRVEIMAIDKFLQTDGNSYVPIPFVHSTDGYALFLNRYEHSVFDLGATAGGAWELQLTDAPLDLYVFANADPARTLQSYSELTGFAPMPAPWLFGIQVCRYWPDFSTAEGILAMAEEMERSGFPWDAVIAEGWDAYNTDTYEDLKAVADALHAMGKKILLYEGCARVSESLEGFQSDYLVREPDGNTLLPETASYNPADNPDPRRCRFLDLTNPEAMEWWYDSVWGALVKDIGVDGCKIDFCEQFPDHMPLEFHDGRDVSGAHHWYPTLYNALMYRYYQEHRPEGGMCFSRGGGIGAQRYPFLWAGDQLREWKFLRTTLTGVLSSGLSGIPFMSYDMAGYRPANNPRSNAEERVFIRGAQMACFSSNMQTHGKVLRPYDFEEPIKDIYREYAKLHQALRPYLLEQAAVSCETGMPLMRHLWLYDPSDANTWGIEDEYLLGCALLVAPVLKDTARRDIYLPRGQWRNLFDGKVYEGGQTLKGFEAAFSRVPVFVLEGHSSETLDGVLEGVEGILGRIAAMR